MLNPYEVSAARVLYGASAGAATIVSAKIRNALQPILLCADSVDDAEALAGIGDLIEIADYLQASVAAVVEKIDSPGDHGLGAVDAVVGGAANG